MLEKVFSYTLKYRVYILCNSTRLKTNVSSKLNPVQQKTYLTGQQIPDLHVEYTLLFNENIFQFLIGLMSPD